MNDFGYMRVCACVKGSWGGGGGGGTDGMVGTSSLVFLNNGEKVTSGVHMPPPPPRFPGSYGPVLYLLLLLYVSNKSTPKSPFKII